MIKLQSEYKNQLVELDDGSQGQIVAVFDMSAYPYAVAFEQEGKDNTYYYRFFNDLGKQFEENESRIVRVLNASTSEIILDNISGSSDQPVDSDSDMLSETEQTTFNSAEISPQKRLNVQTLTLTFPEGVNALEGEFEANSGTKFKVSLEKLC